MSERFKRWLIFIPTLLLIIVLISAFFIYQQLFVGTNAEVAYWEYLDDVSNIIVKDINGDSHSLSDGKNKIVMFLSENCNSCITSLSLFEKTNKIICEEQDVDLILLWENGIPVREVKKHHLETICYSTQNVRIASGYGYSFFIDKDNIVQFYDNSGLSNILTFVKNNVEFNSSALEKNAIDYILSKYGVLNQNNLFFFSMPGCPDCTEATKLLDENDFSKYYHITKIDLDRGGKIGNIVDDCEIFRTAFAIDWYPSFVIIRQDGIVKIVRKVALTELLTVLTPDL